MTSNSNIYTPTKSQHLHYLRQTIKLAQKSPPKPTNFRVGCVIVSYPLTTKTTSSATTASSSPNSSEPQILSTGYTLELPGNTHAEQNALTKLLDSSQSPSESKSQSNPIPTEKQNIYLYTSLEPCSHRLSGNTPCVQRIISFSQQSQSQSSTQSQSPNLQKTKIKIIFGAKEPGTFVQNSQSCKILTEAGIQWEYISDLEEEILRVAMEGHHHHHHHENQDGNNKDDEEGKQEVEVNTDTNTTSKSNQGGNVTNETILMERGTEEKQQPRNRKKRMMEVPPPPSPPPSST